MRGAAAALGGVTHASTDTAGIARLTGAALRALVRGPRTWVGEFLEQCSIVVRRCVVPLFVSASFYIFGVAVMVAAGTLRALGAQDRIGQGVSVGTVREFACWVTAMLVAGIAGTAITSDLGARRIRDELDAMAVLGVDPVRQLVLPRFLALALMTPLLFLWTVFAGGLTGALGAAVVQGLPIASFLESFRTLGAPDVVAALLKMSLMGVLVAAVSCYMGMTASGGPEGVARNVNRAVVVAFVGIWVLNFFFNALFLGLVPEAQDLR